MWFLASVQWIGLITLNEENGMDLLEVLNFVDI